jgi:hypothetical protein
VSAYRFSVATSKRVCVNLARLRRLEPVRVQRAEKEDTDGKQDCGGRRCETPVSPRSLSPGEHREGDQANGCEKRRQPDELRRVHPEQPTCRTDYPRVMSRRSTPERIDEARRAATRNRLIGEGVTEATADAWIAAWDAQAAQDGMTPSAAYWEAGWAWIAEQRRSRVRPPSS